jgi:hypothetical protein
MEDQSTSLGVMVFDPRPAHMSLPSRSFWIHATNGMSERRMPWRVPPHGDPAQRLELFAYTRDRAEWVDQLLAELAVYPFVHGSGLAAGHTLPVQAGAEKPWHGYLLTQPPCERPELNPLAIDIGIADWVFYVQVIGLLQEELEEAIAIGGPAFRQRYLTKTVHAEDLFLDALRPRFTGSPGG